MKTSVIFLLACLTFSVAFGQNAKVVSAYNYLRNNQLDKAKAAIDPAITNETTMGKAKTWFYRGNVYLAIQLTEDTGYRKLDPNALQVAIESYKKALQLDEKKEYNDDILNRIYICGEQFYNKGVENYNKKNYPAAEASFEEAFNLNNSVGKADTLALFNAAFCSELANNNAKTKQLYSKLLELKYDKPSIYSSLSNAYRNDKDTVKALEVVREGRTKFPDDFNLIITETNIYLAKGDVPKAQANLSLALTKDTLNPTIYYAVGTTYDQMGDFAEAEKNYLKAVKLKPDYFEPLYNLGALYFNKGVKIFEDADKITDPTLYDAEKVKYEAAWKKALPYLERALDIEPNDQNTLLSLKQLYARTNQVEKLKMVNDRLNK